VHVKLRAPPEVFPTVNALPVGAVIVRVQLSAVPLAALTYGLGGEPAAMGSDFSVALRLAGEAVE
jgi:hypothetical protein